MEHASETLWTAGFFNERFPAPISPLAWSVLGPLIEEIALRDPLRYLGYPEAETIPLTRLVHGHPYANVRAFQVFYKVFPDFMLPEDAYRYFPAGNTALRKLAPFPSWRDIPRFLFSMLRAFLSDPLNFSPWHNYRKWKEYTPEHDRRVAALRARLNALEQAEPSEIFAALEDAAQAHRHLLRIHRWSLMHADLTFGILRRLMRAWVDREHGAEMAARWVAGVPNKTGEVDAALRDLAEQVGEAAQSGTTFEEFKARAADEMLDACRDFVVKHGHRSFSLDLAVPTFADDPDQILHLLRGIDREHHGRVAQSGDQRASLKGCPVWQRWLVQAVRDLAMKYLALREDQRYYWQKSLAVSRRLYLQLADRLVADGVVDRREDVFFVTHSELSDYFGARLAKDELAAVVTARQREWKMYHLEFQQSPAAAYPWWLRGDTPIAAGQVERAAWQGRAVSPGTARGLARVVQSATDLYLVQRGEILVAPSTDPAWTPVFGRIAGLVLERGGALSHGAVVAREYRVPAVAGILNIASEIRDGEMVEVDGNAGVVARVISSS